LSCYYLLAFCTYMELLLSPHSVSVTCKEYAESFRMHCSSVLPRCELICLLSPLSGLFCFSSRTWFNLAMNPNYISSFRCSVHHQMTSVFQFWCLREIDILNKPIHHKFTKFINCNTATELFSYFLAFVSCYF
jgi:hypothetical protein